MAIIILIPAFICIAALYFWPVPQVFRNVVLPGLLFLPMIYWWKVAALPRMDFADTILLPFGIALVYQYHRQWRFSIMDLWMALFFLSYGFYDLTHGQTTASTFEYFDCLCTFLIPYIAGKLLIEADGARVLVLRRMVNLLFVGAILATVERFTSINLWERFFVRFFVDPDIVWTRQFRGGTARITGPFWQAELAGTMFLTGAILTLWLANNSDFGERFRSALWLPFRKSTIIVATLIVAIVLTQSRGPELGLFFAFPVALVGRARRVLRASLLALAFLAIVGTAAYVGISKYSASSGPASEEQGTAQYRAIMLQVYTPMAEHSGPFGLGPHFPRISYLISIDNEYLFLALTQGYVGLGTFILLCVGTLYNLIWAAIYSPEKSDRSLGFTLIGLFVGILFIIATVFLGLQTHVFFFMIVGWAQSLRARAPRPQPAFEQILT